MVFDSDFDLTKANSYLLSINTDGDEKITQEELNGAKNKVPSLFLEKIKNLANGQDIPVDEVVKGLGIECNPENRPVMSYNDRRPVRSEDWSSSFVRFDKVLTREDYLNDFHLKGRFDVNLPLDAPLNSDLDFSHALWLLQECSFNERTFANTPREYLPNGYDPIKVIELGKDPGLNVHNVHNRGITGKGVNVAIMDWALLNSDNYDENIASYSLAPYASRVEETMHGCAVTSILAGKETGVAPDANVYYFAEMQGDREFSQDMILSFQRMLQINKNLPENEKIRVVSISGTPYGSEEIDMLIEQAEKDGIWVLSSPEFWENFGYLGKVDPMGHPDDFDNYKIQVEANNGRHLYVNSGNRTLTNNTVDGGYRHDSKASASWAIPVVAGYYALACQVDPSITPERFLELAEETAQIKEVDVPFDLEKAKIDRFSSIGLESVLIDFIKEKEPHSTIVQIRDIEEAKFMQYYMELHASLERQGIKSPDEYFVSVGKKMLEAKGQDVMELIDIPETTKISIKIVDIDALINRLQEE